MPQLREADQVAGVDVVSNVEYDVLRPLADELAAAQNDLARAEAIGPMFKDYEPKRAAAALRQAKAIIAICDLVKP